jgi:phosphoglycolate phosphatase-like HAD superfamily hydrolase
MIISDGVFFKNGDIMKKMFKLLVLLSSFYNITGAENITVKQKPIIISDFDEVWIQSTGLIGALGKMEPIKSALIARTDATKLNNFTLRLLDAGRNDAALVPHIPQLIEYMGKSRRINQPINKLYQHFKHKGSPIIIATNKDRILYDYAIEELGNEITRTADKVFVAEPNNGEKALEVLKKFAGQSTTSEKYKDMVCKATNIEPTKKIFHVPSKKPHVEYFTYVINHLDADRDMIFIDDNQKNVDAFNALQKDSPYLRRGIVYRKYNPEPFIQELIELGLVSEKENKKLLSDIRHVGKK